MTTLRSVLILALLAVTARGDDWSGLGRDAARLREPSESIANPAVLTTVASGADAIASPVAVDGFLLLSGIDGVVRAYRESDYAALWTKQTGASILATPVVDKGRVFVPGIDGTLRILRLADGEVLGSIPTGGAGHSSPVLSGGRLFLAATFPNPSLMAVDTASNTVAWTVALDQVTHASPAVGSGLVVVPTNSGTVSAFDEATGAPVWSTVVGGSPGSSSPLLLGSSVYLLTDAMLICLDLSTGAVSGSAALADVAPPDTLSVEYAASSLAVAGGILTGTARIDYALDHNFDGYVDAWTFREFAFAADPAAMTLTWQAPLGALSDVGLNATPPYRIVPSPVSTGADLAFVSSLDATLRVLTAAGGASSSFALDAPGQASPMLANARLYALTHAGSLYVLEDPATPQPASASGLAPSGAHLGASPATLGWSAGPPGASYTVRLAQDGEILMSWDVEQTVAGTSIPCPVLPAEQQYTWAVRVRNADGAYAPWTTAQFALGTPPLPPTALVATPKHARVVLSWARSASADASGYRVAYGVTGGPLGAPVNVGDVSTAAVDNLVIGTNYTFEVSTVDSLGFVSAPVSVAATPVSTITFNGASYATIADALAAAQAGDVVSLAADVYSIAGTLQVPDGVVLRGVDALNTQITTTAAIVMVELATGAAVQQLGLSGGAIGVSAPGQSVDISHCVIRNMSDAGVDVGGIANVINNTIVSNANAGVRAPGRAQARNNIVQGNGTGMVGTVISKYNDVSDGYSGCAPGEGDRSTPVVFLDAALGDYRETANQPSLDAGMPGDAYSKEPSPNGSRINMGAFGNTPLAATSPGDGGTTPACGLLGLEALLLLGLLALRRR